MMTMEMLYQLTQETNAGKLECKVALLMAQGDYHKAKQLLDAQVLLKMQCTKIAFDV